MAETVLSVSGSRSPIKLRPLMAFFGPRAMSFEWGRPEVAGGGVKSTLMAQQAAPCPHIVYIVADDLGWEDVGFHGSDIKTPNIEKLAQDGARLEQFYAQPISGMPASANRLLADERRSAT